MSDVSFRYYQSDAIEALTAAALAGENPVGSAPTGAGKSIIVAGVAHRLCEHGAQRIVITVPSRELAEQNERALLRFFPADQVGVMCAALGRREIDRRVTVGTPQSLAGTIDFDPDYVIVDEAHQMPLHKGSWFARLFAGLPRGRQTPRIGVSATTFRTADGAIYGPKAWFTSQPFEIGVPELVQGGFLAPVRYVSPHNLMTTRGIAKSAGDYNQAQLVQANLDRVDAHVRIILDELNTRRKALVFAVNVEHAEAYCAEFAARNEETALIIGAMSASDRAAAVDDFRTGRVPIAVTVQAALTGFDVPDIDLIASCRPTMSPIIHTQSIGRGTRPASDKDDCLVLDFAGNVRSFGPVHAPHFDRSGQPLGGVAPWRPCRVCGTYCHNSAMVCTHCDAELIARRTVDAKDLEFGTIDWHTESRAIEALISKHGYKGLPVESIALHAYRKASDPTSISCMLSLGLGGDAIVRIWNKHLDSKYWRQTWADLLGDTPAPNTIQKAYARRGELIRPASVSLERSGSFWRLTDVSYEGDEQAGECHLSLAEINTRLQSKGPRGAGRVSA